MAITYKDDSIDSAFIERELEAVKAKTYDKKYADLRFREFIPISHETNPGAETVKFNSFDMFGSAKVIANYADDLPTAAIKKSEVRVSVKSLGASIQYSVQELRAARFAGLPLDARDAVAARRQIEQLMDALAANGDTNNNLTGLTTIPNAQTLALPNGAAGQTLWSKKTGLEILADMTNAVNQVVTSTLDVEHPDTIILTPAALAICASTPVNSAAAASVLEFFLKSNPWVKTVTSWARMTGAGAGGLDLMLVYVRDPDHLFLEIPQEFEMFPAQEMGLKFKIPCHARYAGVLCPYPQSVLYASGT